ncbi:MAG: hypothetical protein VX246_08340 [Myxococcota bacterium]|nr:hypothetical protein [Myxococcota bacterium]
MEDSMAYLEERDYLPARAPSPGLAAVLSVLLPGLGHLYTGRFVAGAAWFVAVGFGYWAILVPGLLLHIICVWASYQGARYWRGF